MDSWLGRKKQRTEEEHEEQHGEQSEETRDDSAVETGHAVQIEVERRLMADADEGPAACTADLAPSSTEPRASPVGGLTQEQRERMERNRALAIGKKRRREEMESIARAAEQPCVPLVELLLPSNGWYDALSGEFDKPYMKKLERFLQQEWGSQTVYPPREHIFNALNSCALKDVKVVILGQDPYHGPGQAHGLSFSVMHGVRPPPSLQNIYKELSADPDVSFDTPSHGNLQKWNERGVLLLNSALTVRGGQASSHSNSGWHQFTDRVIKVVSDTLPAVVFLLWGSKAKAKMGLINQAKHFIHHCAHPSPLSAHRGFIGSRCFSKANAWLRKKGREQIDWSLNPPAH